MGVFKVRIRLVGKRRENVEAVVDTGATFTTLPAPLLRSLGFAPEFQEALRYADGRIRKRPVGPVKLAINGREATVPVVFGGRSDAILIGATTLETLGFSVNPRTGKLTKVQAYAYCLRGGKAPLSPFTGAPPSPHGESSHFMQPPTQRPGEARRPFP